jgi:hypothetical protein
MEKLKALMSDQYHHIWWKTPTQIRSRRPLPKSCHSRDQSYFPQSTNQVKGNKLTETRFKKLSLGRIFLENRHTRCFCVNNYLKKLRMWMRSISLSNRRRTLNWINKARNYLNSSNRRLTIILPQGTILGIVTNVTWVWVRTHWMSSLIAICNGKAFNKSQHCKQAPILLVRTYELIVNLTLITNTF